MQLTEMPPQKRRRIELISETSAVSERIDNDNGLSELSFPVSKTSSIYDLPFHFIRDIFKGLDMGRILLLTLHDNKTILSIAYSLLFEYVAYHGTSEETGQWEFSHLRIDLSGIKKFKLKSKIGCCTSHLFFNVKYTVDGEFRKFKRLMSLKPEVQNNYLYTYL